MNEISKHRGNGQVRICPSSVVSEQRSDADGEQGVAHHTICDISGFSARNEQGHRALCNKEKNHAFIALLRILRSRILSSHSLL